MHSRSFLRIAAMITAVMMLVIVMVLFGCIAVETDHHCIGEHCPVCAHIQQMDGLIHQIGSALGAVIILLIAAFLLLHVITLSVRHFAHGTSVTYKVRLNN